MAAHSRALCARSGIYSSRLEVEKNSPLVVIAGSTGSGKSALALAMACSFGGELVNYDSVQVYRGLDIGSAKTPAGERRGIPHHVLDAISAEEELTAGAFSELARVSLRQIADRRALPILVGGTGFYLRSLLDGLSPAPKRNPDLRRRLRDLAAGRPAALHRFLRRVDAAAAGRIHAHDQQKLIRAIELATSRGSEPHMPRQPLSGFRILRIGLDPPRKELYDRINQRSANMFERGLLKETQGLLDSGVPAQSKALQALGYKQAVAVLENRQSLEEAVAEVQTKTRQYAKRQMTWFRREPEMHWLNGFGDSQEVQHSAGALVADFIDQATM
jgi:tRNA dimethylallyltransferase